MEVFQLQRFVLQKVNYKYSLRKIHGDFKYVPIRERFVLERFGLERGNCIYNSYGWIFLVKMFQFFELP